jgi:hypothetical protein
MKPAEMWTQAKVEVSTKMGPDGALVRTTGSWIPQDAYLVDQLALLSLATKHRIREKLEDSLHVATTRQKTSHGAIPAEWADVAAPIPIAVGNESAGWETAFSPRTNPLKRKTCHYDPYWPGDSYLLTLFSQARWRHLKRLLRYLRLRAT